MGLRRKRAITWTRRGFNGFTGPARVGAELVATPSRESDLPGRKLSVQDAAHFLNLSASTLNKMRLSGTGPPYMKPCRRVVYDVRDLEAWAASRKRNHTSE